MIHISFSYIRYSKKDPFLILFVHQPLKVQKYVRKFGFEHVTENVKLSWELD